MDVVSTSRTTTNDMPTRVDYFCICREGERRAMRDDDEKAPLPPPVASKKTKKKKPKNLSPQLRCVGCGGCAHTYGARESLQRGVGRTASVEETGGH